MPSFATASLVVVHFQARDELGHGKWEMGNGKWETGNHDRLMRMMVMISHGFTSRHDRRRERQQINCTHKGLASTGVNKRRYKQTNKRTYQCTFTNPASTNSRCCCSKFAQHKKLGDFCFVVAIVVVVVVVVVPMSASVFALTVLLLTLGSATPFLSTPVLRNVF